MPVVSGERLMDALCHRAGFSERSACILGRTNHEFGVDDDRERDRSGVRQQRPRFVMVRGLARSGPWSKPVSKTDHVSLRTGTATGNGPGNRAKLGDRLEEDELLLRCSRARIRLAHWCRYRLCT